MNDYEAAQLTVQIIQLRSGTEYRNACRVARQRRPVELANASGNPEDYAAIRLVIGTWNEIAIIAKAFDRLQKRAFFKTQPIELVWNALRDAIYAIRADSNIGPTFAEDFSALHEEYHDWATNDPEGEEYASTHPPTVHAKFDVRPFPAR